MRKKQIGKKLLALLVAVVLSVPNALAVSTLEASSADSSFDEWNIRDVYFTDGWINANKKGVLVEKTLSGSSFSTMVSFPDTGSFNLWIGSGVNQGFVFSGKTDENNQKYLLFQYIVDGTGTKALIDKKLYSEDAGVELLQNKDLKLTLTVENVKTVRKVGVFFNDVLYNYYTCNDSTELQRNVVIDNVGNQKMYLAVPKNTTIREAKVRENAAYNLSNGAYFLTGKEVCVNGVDKGTGDTLNAPGDYEIEERDAGILYRQKVSLYLVGDVDLNGIPCEKTDLTALATYLNSSTGAAVVNSAMEYAADLNNDNQVDGADLKLMEDIISRKTSLDAVLEQYYPPSLSFEYLGGDEVMPIFGYYGPYKNNDVDTLNDDVFRLVKESGVNVITGAVNDMVSNASTDSLKVIELANKYGIGYFMKDWSLNQEIYGNKDFVLTDQEVAEFISRYSFYGNYLGPSVMDEPWPNQNPTNKTPSEETHRLCYYDDFSRQINQFSNLSGYMNLYPGTLWIETERKTAHTAYLKDAVNSANLKAICYDEYPYLSDLTGVKNAKTYMSTLDTVRYVAQESKLPFWGYVQAGDWTLGKALSDAQVYWNVNTLLAFGAKGIGWYPLVQPYSYSTDGAGGREYDRNALIGADGGTTSVYLAAQKINHFIASADEVLMKANSTGVIVTEGYAKSNMASCEHSVITSGKTNLLEGVQTNDTTWGAIVGCFDYGDTEAYYVVNNNIETAQTIQLKFNTYYDYRCLQGESDVKGSGKSMQLTIPAGEAALVVLEEKTGCIVDTYTVTEYQACNGAAPVKQGYVFAGWYSTADCVAENALLEAPTTGNVYAKFVDEAVLSVKMQAQFGTNLDSETTKIRLITTVDSLDYAEVGFDIAVNGKKSPVTTRTVYQSLYGYTDASQKSYTADIFASVSKYFMTYNLTDIPNSYFAEAIAITPKWKTLDGTTVTGITRTFCVRDIFAGSYGVGYEILVEAASNLGQMTVGQYGTGCQGTVQLVTDDKFGTVFGLNVTSPEKTTGSNDYLFRLKGTENVQADTLFFFIYNPTNDVVPLHINTLDTNGANYKNLAAWQYLQPGWNRVDISKEMALRKLVNGIIPEAGKAVVGQWKITSFYGVSNMLLQQQIKDKIRLLPNPDSMTMPQDVKYVEKINEAKAFYDALPESTKQTVSAEQVAKLEGCLEKIAGYSIVFHAATKDIMLGNWDESVAGTVTKGTDAEYGSVFKVNITDTAFDTSKQCVSFFTADMSDAGMTNYKKCGFYIYNPGDAVSVNILSSGGVKVYHVHKSWHTINTGWNWIELDAEYVDKYLHVQFPHDAHANSLKHEWKISSFYALPDSVS